MKNKTGFQSWLVSIGLPQRQWHQKPRDAEMAERAVGKEIDEWGPADVAALARQPVGSERSRMAHAAKLYVAYRMGVTHPRRVGLAGALAALEGLCPSTRRWGRTIGEAAS